MLHLSRRSLNVDQFRGFTFLTAGLLLLHFFATSPASAAADTTHANASPMPLAQVVNHLIARNEARSRALKSYEGTRVYTVHYHGFPKDLDARMVVSMQYDAPNTKEFKVVSQSGSKLLVNEVLKRLLKTETEAQQKSTRDEVNLDRKNYKFSDLKYVPAADGCSYILSVEPTKPNKYLYRGTIRVNDQDFAVCSIQAEPAKNPSFWITSTIINEAYKKFGEFWLPAQNKSVSKMRFGGTATLTIEYQNYKIQGQPLTASESAPSSRSGVQ